MASIKLSEIARAEIVAALVYTEERYGTAKREAYQRLIADALSALAQFPQLGPARPEIHPQARSLALAQRGQHARHLLLYRIGEAETVEIARCVHDAMHLELPSDW